MRRRQTGRESYSGSSIVRSLRLQVAHPMVSSVPSSHRITLIPAFEQMGQIMKKHSLKPRSMLNRIVESAEKIMFS